MKIYFKYRGLTSPNDPWHQIAATPIEATGVYGPPPILRCIDCVGCVSQYAKTVVGDWAGFGPATDCNGYFTSKKYQVHNNCYNYALDIASNSFAWPGRLHKLLLKPPLAGDLVVRGAELDGLILLGSAADCLDDACEAIDELDDDLQDGHLVALLIAQPDAKMSFPGDFHWIRCDDLDSSSWSQKDGPDEVTTWDFAGRPVVNPRKADWTTNCGPDGTGRDLFISYDFRAWMYVPHGRVSII